MINEEGAKKTDLRNNRSRGIWRVAASEIESLGEGRRVLQSAEKAGGAEWVIGMKSLSGFVSRHGVWVWLSGNGNEIGSRE